MVIGSRSMMISRPINCRIQELYTLSHKRVIAFWWSILRHRRKTSKRNRTPNDTSCPRYWYKNVWDNWTEIFSVPTLIGSPFSGLGSYRGSRGVWNDFYAISCQFSLMPLEWHVVSWYDSNSCILWSKTTYRFFPGRFCYIFYIFCSKYLVLLMLCNIRF